MEKQAFGRLWFAERESQLRHLQKLKEAQSIVPPSLASNVRSPFLAVDSPQELARVRSVLNRVQKILIDNTVITLEVFKPRFRLPKLRRNGVTFVTNRSLSTINAETRVNLYICCTKPFRFRSTRRRTQVTRTAGFFVFAKPGT